MTLNPVTIGRHQVQRPLGRGGMGTVYLAWDPKLERQLAVKLLKENDPELRERFEREAVAAARLRHPHIVTIYDVGEHEGQPFIAMEYIGGQTLADAIRERQPLSITRKLELIGQMCDGLGFAHRTGIVHRDVKPANMMVDASGALKILDFGIARIAESASMTQAGTMMGTLNYMSPEQVMGQTVDHRSDIFAVGAVLYELVSYRQAFPGTLSTGVLNRILNEPPRPLTEVCPDVDPVIVRIVARATEKEAARRYQDLAAMAKDLLGVRLGLDAIAATSGPTAPQRHAPTPTPRPGSREELVRRRRAQIDANLARASQALAAGDYDATIAACDDVRMLDAEEPRALELIGRAQAALDERQAHAWLTEAQQGLQRGAFTAARELIDRAATLTPGSSRVAELRQALDEAVRARDEARRRQQQRQALLASAESNLDLGQFEEALRAADAFLAEEPDHAGGRLIRTQAADGLLAQSKAREAEAAGRRAREAIDEAERRARAGHREEAIDLLARFEPSHELVNRALAQMRAEAARWAPAPGPEVAETVVAPARAEGAESVVVPGGTVLIARRDEPLPATEPIEARSTGRPKAREDRGPVPPRPATQNERRPYLVPAVAAAITVVALGGLTVYLLSQRDTPSTESPPTTIAGSVDPPPAPVPSPGPSPPALDPPPPDDPVAPDQQAQQEWRRADNAATAARRAAEAGGQPVVGTSAYREGLAQEQEADAAFRRGRLADATAAARRAGELYARAVREAAARPTEPLRVGGDVPAPRVTKSVDPVYPPAAIAARVGGSVQVEAQIDASGRVTGARVVRSLPPLDQAALDAVRQWEFAPTVVAGNAVSVLHTVDVPFTPPPVPEPPARPEPGPPNTPPTTLPPPRPVPVDEAAAVRSTIDALAQAYNRRDINAILAIHRTADRASLERYFAGLEYLRAEFSGGRVTLTANNTEATLTGNWIITYRTTTTRGEDRASTPTTFRLRKDGQRWILVSRK